MSRFQGIIVPKLSVTLTEIDLKQVRDNYFNDVYTNIVIPKLETKIKKQLNTFSKKKTNTADEDVYRVNCRIGSGTELASDNCVAYENSKRCVRCHYCRRDVIKNKSGLALDVIFNDKEIQALRKGYFCDRRCQLAYSIEKNKKCLASQKWENIIKNIYLLHHLQSNTECNLLPANNWKLLAINGGSLEDEEWEDENYFYEQQPNIVYIRAKSLYEKKLWKP